MKASDVRHLQRMRMVIDDTRANRTSLIDAANSLLFLCNAMESLDRLWADRFTSCIATLESAGTATAEQRLAMGAQYHELIDSTLRDLSKMIECFDVSLVEDE